MIAVLGQPNTDWTSQRDHLLLSLLYNTGARVSEIVEVRVVDVVLDGAACVHLHGKGRKDRSVPLWKSTAAAIRAWLRANPELRGSAALLPNRSGHQMTRCKVAQRLALAVDRATRRTAEPQDKACLAPHLEALDSHAPAAKRRSVQRDRPVARPREH
jgi:site-specific recombinase XerD